MAECSSDSKNEHNHTNGNKDDDDDFCDQFRYFNISTCCICNGYYGPNFGEPLCGTCHAFLFSVQPQVGIEEQSVIPSDDEDSGNDEPPYSVNDRQDRDDLEAELPEEVSENEQEENEFELEPRPEPAPPQNVNHYINLLSHPHDNNKSDKNIDALPVEVLLKIFSYLDDISLCNVSGVCKQWRKILETHTPQSMWKKYTKERWPLFQHVGFVSNWFQVYSSLMSSCFCRTCVIQMALKTPFQSVNHLRSERLLDDIRSLDVDATEGIDAVPLDHQLSHWQASIKGPMGSPYEGGKFFLYIVIPSNYPMLPPTVRFLTKIFHPNVSRHGDVGIDIIQHNWLLSLTISKILLSVQSLLTDPFTEICMEPELGKMYENDRPKFEALARRWTCKYAKLELNIVKPPS